MAIDCIDYVFYIIYGHIIIYAPLPNVKHRSYSYNDTFQLNLVKILFLSTFQTQGNSREGGG